MRFLRHLSEAEIPVKDEKEEKDKKEVSPEEKEKQKKAEEKTKAIEGFIKMLLKATMPSQMNMIVQQVAPMYIKWGEEWLNEFEKYLKETVSDRLRHEFIKVVKNASVRYHHIKPENGEAPADIIDKKVAAEREAEEKAKADAEAGKPVAKEEPKKEPEKEEDKEKEDAK